MTTSTSSVVDTPHAEAVARETRRLRWVLPLMAVILAAFCGPTLARHVNASRDHWRFNDDAGQQVWPFLRFGDPNLFRRDLTADYYLACFPLGYQSLYAAGATVVDPRTLSKVLPYALLAILAAAAALAAGRLRGAAAAWGAVAFCLAAPVFLGRMAGGLPRSFAFPLYALLAAALVSGRPVLLATIACAGAAFYPSVGVVAGIALAILLLLYPARLRGGAARWGWPARLVLLTVTAGAAILIVLPTHRWASRFGPLLRPADVARYPEIGPGGRYADDDRPHGFRTPATWINYARAPLAGLGGAWEARRGWLDEPMRQIPLYLKAGLGTVGFALLARRDDRARRLLALPAAVVVAHLLSIPLTPHLYLPSRYLTYPLAALAVIIVPAGWATLGERLVRAGPREAARWVGVFVGCGVFLCVFTFGAAKLAGIKHCVTQHRKTYAFLTALPPDAVIAGWPTDMDDVPYLTGRSVLISREGHQAFHAKYADEMRRRMGAVIDATYAPAAPDATGPSPLARLRDGFGVTHFILNRSRYGEPALADAAYFKPFDERIRAVRASAGGAEAAALRAVGEAAVFVDGDWIVLDLSRLPGAEER